MILPSRQHLRENPDYAKNNCAIKQLFWGHNEFIFTLDSIVMDNNIYRQASFLTGLLYTSINKRVYILYLYIFDPYSDVLNSMECQMKSVSILSNV